MDSDVKNQEPQEQKGEQQEQTPPVKNDDILKVVSKELEQFRTNITEQFTGEIKAFEEEKKVFQSEKKKHEVRQLLFKNNLESDLLDFVYDDDVEVVNIKIGQLNKIIDNRVERAKMAVLKQNSYTPPKGHDNNTTSKNKPGYFL